MGMSFLLSRSFLFGLEYTICLGSDADGHNPASVLLCPTTLIISYNFKYRIDGKPVDSVLGFEDKALCYSFTSEYVYTFQRPFVSDRLRKEYAIGDVIERSTWESRCQFLCRLLTICINDPPQESPACMPGEECGVPFSGQGGADTFTLTTS
jgi:hypothetical protein